MTDEQLARFLARVPAERAPSAGFVDALMARIEDRLAAATDTTDIAHESYISDREEPMATIVDARPRRPGRRVWLSAAAAAALVVVIAAFVVSRHDSSRSVDVVDTPTTSYATSVHDAYVAFTQPASAYWGSCVGTGQIVVDACHQRATLALDAAQRLVDRLDALDAPSRLAASHARLRASVAAMIPPLEATVASSDARAIRSEGSAYVKAWDCAAFAAYNAATPPADRLVTPGPAGC